MDGFFCVSLSDSRRQFAMRAVQASVGQMSSYLRPSAANFVLLVSSRMLSRAFHKPGLLVGKDATGL